MLSGRDLQGKWMINIPPVLHLRKSNSYPNFCAHIFLSFKVLATGSFFLSCLIAILLMIFYLKSYLNVNYQGKKRTFTLIDIRSPLTNNLLPDDSELTANEIISYKAKITYK